MIKEFGIQRWLRHRPLLPEGTFQWRQTLPQQFGTKCEKSMWYKKWAREREVQGRQRSILTEGPGHFPEMEAEIDIKGWIQEVLLWSEHREEIQGEGNK